MGEKLTARTAGRVEVLLAHLLKWRYPPERHGSGWRRTIATQGFCLCLKESPSLKAKFHDPEWMDLVWQKAVAGAVSQTDLDVFPESCYWFTEQIMDPEFWPET